VLAGLESPGQQCGARLRRRGIKKDGIFLVGKRSIEIGGPPRNRKALRQRFYFRWVAADQYRIGHDSLAIGKSHAALLADRDDRTDQMLVQPHAAGHTVHDHAEALRRHGICSCTVLTFACRSGDIVDHLGWAPAAKPRVTSESVRRSPS